MPRFPNPLTSVLPVSTSQGGTVARFAGQNVHKRLVSEEEYRNKEYEAALKRAFLGTDQDILAGMSVRSIFVFLVSYDHVKILAVHETPLVALQLQL